MKIVADENIPFVNDAFGDWGEVVILPSKKITKEIVTDADILIVRSTIKVNGSLLEDSSVKYIATTTIGFDHLDIPYLEKRGIKYCNAPGSNADSVADYMVAALLYVAKIQNTSLEGKTIGVIGCGNIGSRVVKRARGLGMRVIENDPPLARLTHDERYRPLDEIFCADYISLHTPITYKGCDATYHLVDEFFLSKMRKDAFLFNVARGAVVDNAALKNALQNKNIEGAVMDVWENEPAIDPDLLRLVLIGTPHIAGHSLEGKINGIVQVYHQICKWLNKEEKWKPNFITTKPQDYIEEIDAFNKNDEDVLREAVFGIYLIKEDDAIFRKAMLEGDPSEHSKKFDFLRKYYHRKREFSLVTIQLKNGNAALVQKLNAAGFKTVNSDQLSVNS